MSREGIEVVCHIHFSIISDIDSSVMEAVAKFGVNFARVVPVESAEGLAVVEQQVTVGDVKSVQRRGEAFAKILFQGKIKGCVLGEMSGAATVSEAGAVINIGRSEAAPGQANVSSDVQSVALVVVKEEQGCGRGEIGEASGDRQSALGDLVGVRQVNLAAMRNSRGPERGLPAANRCVRDGD